VRAGLACLLFAGAETLQIRLQAAQLIPSQFVAMIPYVLTIVAVAGVVGRSTPPAALAEPPMRERCGRVCPPRRAWRCTPRHERETAHRR